MPNGDPQNIFFYPTLTLIIESYIATREKVSKEPVINKRRNGRANEILGLNTYALKLDWLQSLKSFFINVSYHILVASLTVMALFFHQCVLSYTCSQSNSDGSVFFINVSYHILVASLTLMDLFFHQCVLSYTCS